MKAFRLEEITAMQLKCIKQLNSMKETILENRRTRGINRRASTMDNTGDVIANLNQEISQRKHWAMNPVEVQV